MSILRFLIFLNGPAYMLNEILGIPKYVFPLSKYKRYIFKIKLFVFVFSKDKEICKVEGQY